MRSESCEKRLTTTRRAMRRASESIAAENICTGQSDALDSAFEDYARIDVGIARSSSTDSLHQVTKSLVADIATQLDALDRQRQMLTDLLRNVSL